MSRILAIDRGSKRIGLAWMESDIRMPLPLRYIYNDADTFAQLASLMVEYAIDTLLYGYPAGNTSVTDKIDRFVNNLRRCVSDNVSFVPLDEHYSSTEASARTGDLGSKHISQDTVSAMMLLERRQKNR